jgi:transposase-like protein
MAKSNFNISDPIFHDEDKAREHLEALLWPHGPSCPRCGVLGDRITKLQGKSTRPGVYKCKDCRKPFTVTIGTVMERSHIPLTKWLMATYFMATAKKSMSAMNLQRLIDVSYEAAWFLFHRLRECTDAPASSGPVGGSNKVVEVDETYIGGKEKNKHASKRKHEGRGAVGKMPVVSLVERDGKRKSFHVANVTAKTLRPILTAHMDTKSYLMTDESALYPQAGKEFSGHGTVNHSAGEYVRTGGFHHTNTVESHFALIKRGIYGQFHSVSEAHLPRYLAEFDFRANTRDLSDKDRADNLISGAKGKRLMYRQPDGAAYL